MEWYFEMLENLVGVVDIVVGASPFMYHLKSLNQLLTKFQALIG